MTTITQFLTPYYSSNLFFQLSQNLRLKTDITAWANTSEGGKFFLWALRRSIGGDGNDATITFSPDDVLKFCNSSGFVNVEDILNWCEAFKGNAQGMADSISHRIILNTSSMDDMDYATYITNIKALSNTIGDGLLVWSKHDKLKLLDKASVDKIVSAIPTAKFQYRLDDERCTDFTDMAMGWVKTCGYGNITMADCEVQVKDSTGNVVAAHSLLHLLYKDNGNICAAYLDPESGIMFDTKVFPSKGPVMGATSYVIYRVSL